MKLKDRYNLENLGNRTQELVFQTIQRLLDTDSSVCPCEECVLDLAAWTLNHATPRYYTSLLAPLHPDTVGERQCQGEVDKGLAAALKKIKRHPHHQAAAGGTRK
jgi:competence protein ComFB